MKKNQAIHGEIVGLDLSDRIPGKSIVEIAYDQDVTVGHCNVVVLREEDFEEMIQDAYTTRGKKRQM